MIPIHNSQLPSAHLGAPEAPCRSANCGLRFENGRYVGPPSRPGVFRRLIQRLRKETP